MAGQSVSVVGGLQVEGAWHVSAPLARITITESSVEIGASHKLLRPFVRRWSSPLDELSEVQPIGLSPGPISGIRFKRRGSIDWIIFWTLRGDELADFLQSQGVSVNPPKKHKKLFPGSDGGSSFRDASCTSDPAFEGTGIAWTRQ
jgi:hypothetical protein